MEVGVRVRVIAAGRSCARLVAHVVLGHVTAQRLLGSGSRVRVRVRVRDRVWVRVRVRAIGLGLGLGLGLDVTARCASVRADEA